MTFTTIAKIRDVIAASDPRHDNKKPTLDLKLLRESVYELIALHLQGKAARNPPMQEILDLVAKYLTLGGKPANAKTPDERFALLITVELQQAILRIERQLAEL